MKAILTIGIPGSGKTTWAEQQVVLNGFNNINRDDLRMSLFGLEHYSDYVFSRKNEKIATDKVHSIIDEYAKGGMDIIISDTNLNEMYRNKMVKRLEGLRYDVEFKEFPISFETALKRNDKRADKTIPRAVLFHMWKAWLEYKGQVTYEGDPSKEPCFVFDIDGTLANMGSRHPFAWDKVQEDKPVDAVVDMLRLLNENNTIIVLSGRDGRCQETTEDWLTTNNIPYSRIFMRTEGDCRKDTEIKMELFNKFKDDYNVKGVFDDRNQMVRMWKELGIPVFNMGHPDDEF